MTDGPDPTGSRDAADSDDVLDPVPPVPRATRPSKRTANERAPRGVPLAEQIMALPRSAGPSTPPDADPVRPPDADPTTLPDADPMTLPDADPATPSDAVPTTRPDADPAPLPDADPTTPPDPTPATQSAEVALVPVRARDVPPPAAPAPRPALTTRFSREALGLVALAVVAVLFAVVIAVTVAKTNADTAAAAKEIATYAPPSLAAPAARADLTVVVIGDETVTKAASGVSSTQRWPALLGTAVKGRVSTFASAGAGYTASGSSGSTFADRAAQIPASAAVVIFFGGLNDADAPALDVSKQATKAFSAAKKQAPKARFLVVGPVVGGAVSSSDSARLRGALKASAAIADFTWIDPISNDWLDGAATKPATTLSKADEAAISSRLTATVRSALG